MEDKLFEQLIKYVQAGLTIQNACKSLELNRSVIYRKLTITQKERLKKVKQMQHVLSQERNNANRYFKLGIEIDLEND